MPTWFDAGAVALVTVLAVISPGPDFAMVTQLSLRHGRRAGLLAALGIAAGVQLHVFYSLAGVGLLLRGSPAWLTAFKLAGAAYLVVVGWRTFHAAPMPHGSGPPHGFRDHAGWPAWRAGFLTNALNPKTTLFVLSVYTQLVRPGTPWPLQVGYGLFMSLAHLLWFSLVATVFSHAPLRRRVLERQRVLNRGIGLALMALGAGLLWPS